MKRALVGVKLCNGHPRYSYVCHFRQGGKRRTCYFVHKKDAQAFACEKQVELLNQGRKHGELSEEERRAVIEAREIAETMNKEGFEDFSLRAAIEHYVRHLRTLRTSKTVERAGEEFLEMREGEGRSATHLADLRHRVNRFTRAFQGRIVAGITPQEAEYGNGAKMQCTDAGQLSACRSQLFLVLHGTELRAIQSARGRCAHKGDSRRGRNFDRCRGH